MSTGPIVVGVDGSESSRDALRWAKAQADATGSDLVAASAWSYPVASYPTLAGYVPMDNLDIEAETQAALEQIVKETLGEATISLTVLEGHPANAIIELARDSRASLVVMGSRGHGGFVGALVGSVSQHVVTHAPCPVVVIRHPKDSSA